MLVLSRKPGEQIRIGDQITITLVEVRGNRVRLGIEAPDSCRILRGELYQWDAQECPAPEPSSHPAESSLLSDPAWIPNLDTATA
jgi:carbon storage regulator